MSKLSENSGKIISQDEAKKIHERHTANKESIEKSVETYIQSFFFGVNILNELVKDTPVKDLLGVRINLGLDDKGDKTITLEPIKKDKKPVDKLAATDFPCPTACME